MKVEVTRESLANTPSAPEELEQRLVQQALVAEFGRYALRNHDLDAVLEEACRVAAEGLQVRFAKVLECLEEGEPFLLRAGVGWGPGLVGHAQVGADLESPGGYAFRTGEPVISNHLTRETRFRTPQLLADHGVVRAVNVVIRGDGEPYGVLEADSRDPGAFSPHDVAFMQALANTLGLAIEKEKALNDKRLVSREIDHRIKNSLMLVSSVLAMQQRNAVSPEAKAALVQASDRVGTIARIHDQLHRSATADSVEFGSYLRALARDLMGSLARNDADLTLEAESVDLAADRAAPLGLIAAELLMNALKHARRERERSHLGLSFRRDGDALELVVADDGPGLPAGFDPAQSKGLGMRLILSLVRQIEGTFEAGNHGEGARFIVRCPAEGPG
ncbi:signal transduction histidine kinase [Rubellimicrobium mesophilum DSM 19309]|uniref:histidine kinase n=1 Tax=Rubellimicrobium mesophilum DSM 19309 TaxID=442562 RepID=A0A017HTE4_9RHOB|nr:histidine kinase dimerization/phosphoacceptor domain -containing protein [Rubellimicrobium mesophilum]EYD77570.1 signal transduction histidine kinase [Rubellimicrobium mesophilum DSM 19309]